MGGKWEEMSLRGYGNEGKLYQLVRAVLNASFSHNITFTGHRDYFTGFMTFFPISNV